MTVDNMGAIVFRRTWTCHVYTLTEDKENS